MLWIQNFKKMIRQTRKTATKDLLKQLLKKGLILKKEVIKEIKAEN